MKKLTATIVLAGVGIAALARRAANRQKATDRIAKTGLTPSKPASAAAKTTPPTPAAKPATTPSIDPGIAVQSPFTGDPGMVVRSPFKGDPGIVVQPKKDTGNGAAPKLPPTGSDPTSA